MSGDALAEFHAAMTAALGGAPDTIEPGRLYRFSTNGKHGDKSGWCQFFADGLGGVYGDFRSGESLVWTSTNRDRMTPAERTEQLLKVARAREARLVEQQIQYEKNARIIKKMWSETRAVTEGDPVALYLRHRGLAGPVPECLRLHPCATYWEDGEKSTHPAMIAPMVSPDGRVLALHRTYLTTDGRKASVATVKKLTGAAGSLAGACIPLRQPMDGILGVAEGIETALAAYLASGIQTASAYSANGLASYIWPQDLRCLVIFADPDSAGVNAAERLRQRVRATGVIAIVKTPSAPGLDWCEVWAQRGNVGTEGVKS